MINKLIITLLVSIALSKINTSENQHPQFTTYNKCFSYQDNKHYGIGPDGIGWPECHKQAYDYQQNYHIDQKYNGYCTLMKPVGKYYEYEDQVSYSYEAAKGKCFYYKKIAINVDKQQGDKKQVYDISECICDDGRIVESKDKKCYVQSYQQHHRLLTYHRNRTPYKRYNTNIQNNQRQVKSYNRGHYRPKQHNKQKYNVYKQKQKKKVSYQKKRPIQIRYKQVKEEGYCLYKRKVPVHTKVKVERIKFEAEQGYCEYIEKPYVAPTTYESPAAPYEASAAKQEASEHIKIKDVVHKYPVPQKNEEVQQRAAHVIKEQMQQRGHY